jgi:bacterioferritin-associated ferredoxin
VLICHCKAVNEATIRCTILAGAREPADVARACGAGSECGGCMPALLELLDELDDRRQTGHAHTSAA